MDQGPPRAVSLSFFVHGPRRLNLPLFRARGHLGPHRDDKSYTPFCHTSPAGSAGMDYTVHIYARPSHTPSSVVVVVVGQWGVVVGVVDMSPRLVGYHTEY